MIKYSYYTSSTGDNCSNSSCPINGQCSSNYTNSYYYNSLNGYNSCNNSCSVNSNPSSCDYIYRCNTPKYCCTPSCPMPPMPPPSSSTPNQDNLNEMEKGICSICRTQYSEFLKLPHVVGVGFGFKNINGYLTDMDCITVYVDKKLSNGTLPPSAMVPPMYNGIPTDVVESGAFENFISLKDRIRPAVGGTSISTSRIRTAGTLGCLVRDSKGLYILSNNHVLADINSAPLGTLIVQPGLIDGGTTPANVIATLDRFVQLQFATFSTQPENEVDCAIALVTIPSLVTSKIASIDAPPSGIVAPTLNVGVKKVGRTTGLTSGIVNTISTTILNGGLLYVDQIVATTISDPGDSGSLVVDVQNRAMGLLNSGSQLNPLSSRNFSVINPIRKVLAALGVSLVTS